MTTSRRWLRRAPLLTLLAGLAIVAFATNLRITIGSLGVLLDDVSADLGMSPSVAGLLTTLPLVAFATVGFASPLLVRRIGLHRTAVLVLLVMAAGVATRAVAGSTTVFLASSAVALSAVAIGNVILPPLVKANFPDRIPLMSSLYGAAVMAGITVASALTVPVSNSVGSWRGGMAVWAAVALVAVVPWMMFSTPERGRDLDLPRVRLPSVFRSRTMWALAACFGVQSAHAYAQFGWYAVMLNDAGLSDSRAGLMLSLITGIGIPLTLCLPLLIRLIGGGVTLPVLFGAASAAGWAGVLFAPATHTWLWSLLLGMGGVSFTWTLTMIGRKAPDAETTATLSSATQGIGYLIAGIGPLAVAIAHDLTGSWSPPLTALLLGSSLITLTGIAVVRSPILAHAAVHQCGETGDAETVRD